MVTTWSLSPRGPYHTIDPLPLLLICVLLLPHVQRLYYSHYILYFTVLVAVVLFILHFIFYSTCCSRTIRITFYILQYLLQSGGTLQGVHYRGYTTGGTLQGVHYRGYTTGGTLQGVHYRGYTTGGTHYIVPLQKLFSIQSFVRYYHVGNMLCALCILAVCYTVRYAHLVAQIAESQGKHNLNSV